jgi:hypothetical protein
MNQEHVFKREGPANVLCHLPVRYFSHSRFSSHILIRGKEALVEKFKNSCIMDEREEWKPMVY